MKILLLLLFTVQLVLCEVPPPYSRRGFRPNQPLLLPLLSQPQRFIAPSQQYNSARIINGGSPYRPESLQQSYGPPSKFQNQPQSTYGPPSYQKPPSSLYGVPNKPDVIYGLPGVAQKPSQSRPQSTYGPPSAPQEVLPQFYGTPHQAQTTYGPPNRQGGSSQNYITPHQIQSLPQAFRPLDSQSTPSQNYGPPNKPQSAPQNTYEPSSSQIAPYAASGIPSKIQRPLQAFGVQNSQVTSSQLNGIPSKLQAYETPTKVPQSTYGTPDLRVEPLQTPRQAFSGSNVPMVQNLPPQTSYGVPAPSQVYGAPSKIQGQPQTTYGVPSGSNGAQSIFNVTPAPQKSPAQTYGVPSRTPDIETLERLKNQQFSNLIPTNQQLPVKEPENFERFQQSLPLREAGDFRSGLPSQQYLPVREAETFNQHHSSNLNQLSQQYLPVKDAQNFRQGFERNTAISNSFQGDFGNLFPGSSNDQDRPRPHTTVDIQKVDVQAVTPLYNNYPPLSDRNPSHRQPKNINKYPTPDFGTEAPRTYPEDNQTEGPTDEKKRNITPQGSYIPPLATTTEKPVLKRPTKSSQTPVTPRPELDTDQENQEDENETTERDETPTDGQPNIAIATAVAGGASRHFYLLQPDGRLQRVTLEKTQEPADGENEYTANYLFQNIQPEPNGVYAPLISLVNK